MKLTKASLLDTLRRSAKTFLQTLMGFQFATLFFHGMSGLKQGLVSAASAGGSVVWNTLQTLLGAEGEE